MANYLSRFKSQARGFLTLASALSLITLSASADNFLVNKTVDDDGACTVDDCALREAVNASNDNPGMDIVELPAGTYPLTILEPLYDGSSFLTGDIKILDDLELRGESADTVTILGTGNDRVLEAFSTTLDPINVIISGVTITGGKLTGNGGGIRFGDCIATISNSVIRDNVALSGRGGGIATQLADLTLINSSVVNNTSDGFGGGIYIFGLRPFERTINIVNSTVSGNSSTYEGGGGLFMRNSTVNVIHSSIVGNSAALEGSAVFGSLSQIVNFTNSIITGDCRFPTYDPPISSGGNIESPGATCLLVDPTDRMNVPTPVTAPLADNGGSTPTHAVFPGSPAVDTAVDANCVTTDQRGEIRPYDGNNDGTAECDVGAYEFTGAPVVAIPALGDLGLLILTTLLGLTGFRIARRR